MAKAVGISENEFKGKSLDEQIKLISKRINEEKEDLKMEAAKEYLDNYKNQVPEVKDLLGKPFEIYVKKVGQKKTPTTVQVMGYNSNAQTLIVLFSDKLYQIKDEDLIKSPDELIKEKPRAKTGTGKKKTK